MAIIYYPSGSTQYVRNVVAGGMVEQFINVAPNQIIFLSGSTIGVPADITSASYAQTASYASNAGAATVGGYVAPTFEKTSSTWILSQSNDIQVYNAKTIDGQNRQLIYRGARGVNDSHSLWIKPMIPTPYSMVVGFQHDLLEKGGNYTKCGLLLYDTASSKEVIWVVQYSAGWGFFFAKYNNSSSYNNSYLTTTVATNVQWLPIFLALTDDGTNLTASYSLDNGASWVNAYNVSRTDFLTPNAMGLVMDAPPSNPALYNMFHYTESAPISTYNLR